MKVVFRTNLGSRDAAECKRAFGDDIDHTNCTIGAEVTVSDDAADWLLSRGIAELPEKPKPKKVQAVPPAAAIATAKDTKTKADV